MKKQSRDKTLRRAGIVSVLVLVTLSLVGGTLAKYTGTGGGTAEARVAKFKVSGGEFDSEAFNLDSLKDNWPGEKPVIIDGEIDYPGKEYHVWSNNTDTELLAPGTSGQFMIDLVNDSEVTVNATLKISQDEGATIPIEYSLISYDASGKVSATTKWADLTALNTALSNSSITLDKGTATQTVTVCWRWLYERGTGDAEIAINDAADTELAKDKSDPDQNGFDTTAYKLTAEATFTQAD